MIRTVFIGSTSIDLQKYRETAIAICLKLELLPIAMEHFGAKGTGATEASLREVDKADVYVGIFAYRYGYIESGYDRSVTEMEFDYAGEQGLERLCFLVEKKFPWPREGDDENLSVQNKLREFKSKINTLVRTEFGTVDDFSAKLTHALVNWKDSQEPSRKIISESSAILAHKPDDVPEQPGKLFGREELQLKTEKYLRSGNQAVLWGFGGMGKTALAATIAARYAQKGAVLWLHVRHATIISLIEAVARAYGVSQALARRTTEREKTSWLREHLGQTNLTLLVVDDVWDETLIATLKKVVPKNLPLLVTSRYMLSGINHDIQVDELSPEKSLDLLMAHAGGKVSRDAIANELCQRVGYHPYALELIGKTLNANKVTAKEFLQEIDKKLPMTPDDTGDTERLTITDIVRASLEILAPEVRQVFHAFGALFVPHATSELMSLYMRSVKSKIDIEGSLQKLAKSGLVKKTHSGQTYSMYDVAFIYAKNKFEQQNRLLIIQACSAYANNFKFTLDALDVERENLLGAAQHANHPPNQNLLVDIMWSLCVGEKETTKEPYFDVFGHSLVSAKLLENAGELAKKGSTNDRACYLLAKLGNYYAKTKGDLIEGLKHYEAAHALAEKQKMHCYQAKLLSVIATTEQELNRIAEVDAHLEQAIRLAKQHRCKKVFRAQILEHRGYVAGLRGDFKMAEGFLLESLRLAKEVDNAERKFYALLSLGMCAQELGNLDEALSRYSEAEVVAKPYPTWLSSTLESLGEVHHLISKRESVDKPKQRKHQVHAQKYLDAAAVSYEQNGETAYLKKLEEKMRHLGYKRKTKKKPSSR